MRGHDAFEALAGAVMLGEATADERARFDAHARACAACRADVAGATVVSAAVAQARGAETWRPSVTGAVLERIARTRARGARRTIGAFGWAIALSIVVNIAAVSGATAWLAPGFRGGADAGSSVASSTMTFDRRASRIVAAPTAGASRALTSQAIARERRMPHRIAFGDRGYGRRGIVPSLRPSAATTAAAVVANDATPSTTNASRSVTDAVPDVLAGLDVESGAAADGTLRGRRVALEPRACAEVHADPGGGVRDAARDAVESCLPAASPAPAPK